MTLQHARQGQAAEAGADHRDGRGHEVSLAGRGSGQSAREHHVDEPPGAVGPGSGEQVGAECGDVGWTAGSASGSAVTIVIVLGGGRGAASRVPYPRPAKRRCLHPVAGFAAPSRPPANLRPPRVDERPSVNP